MNKPMLPSKVQEQGSASKFSAFIQHPTGGQSQCSKAKEKDINGRQIGKEA